MEEINHFGHEDHPLKLIDWETIRGTMKGDANEENSKGVVKCDICEEPLSVGEFAYTCIQCRFFLHKSCSQLPETIHFPSIYQNPLQINILKKIPSGLYSCRVCCRRITKGFLYASEKRISACSDCFLAEFARKAEADAIKEEAKIKLEHKSHPQHPLTLKLRPGSFLCDACKTEERDLFYECDTCDFWIHKSCATLAPTIHLPHHHPKHPLVLVYSLPEKFFNYSYYCKICNKYVRRDDWLYHCGNCRFFAHIKCALKAETTSTSRDDPSTSAASDDVHSLLHFPMLEAFTDPLKLLHSNIIAQNEKETAEINHWSHPAHPLVLNVEDLQGNNMMPDINSGDPIKVCYACVRPLSFPYYSCKEDGCSVFTDLHKYCAHLPRTLQHQLHPDHTLDLVDTWEDKYFYRCTGCFSRGNTFAYKCKMNCNFCFCVNCAFLPKTIKHESHNHHLIQVIDPNYPLCNSCGKWSDGISYACKDCDFILGMYCAMRSPKSLAHRYCKGHDIPLTYPPVEDHPEDFYCDICEEEMDPKFWLYHCHNHKSRSSFHLRCISRIDYYANVWYSGTRTRAYHKHPLTYVRRKKTPKYVCSVCNQDINGYLVLECQAKTCNFVICYYCHLNKEW